MKGAPESVLPLCDGTGDDASAALTRLYDEGARVVAVASRPVPGTSALGPDSERGLVLRGFLAFTPGWQGAAATASQVRECSESLGVVGLDVLMYDYAGMVLVF